MAESSHDEVVPRIESSLPTAAASPPLRFIWILPAESADVALSDALDVALSDASKCGECVNSEMWP